MNRVPICRQEVVVKNENGLHLVPCSKIAQSVRDYDCRVRIAKGSFQADAKEVLDLMALAAEKGTRLLVEAEGPDAPQAVERLRALFEAGFEGGDTPSAE